MSLDRMLGSVRCNSGRQRALISFEKFVGLGVRMPTRDETCVSPTELCKFPQIIYGGGTSPPGCRREIIWRPSAILDGLRKIEHEAYRQLQGRR
jgi:hypothetical protein